jgi:hypothetical protein
MKANSGGKMKKFNKLVALFLVLAIATLSINGQALAASRKTISVTDVKLDKSSLTLTEGGAAETLTATVSPYNAKDKRVTWKTNNPNVATVSNGMVSPVAEGTATITVTTVSGSKTASCAVTVKQNVIAVEGISLDKSSLSLTKGGSAETLTATVSPADATNKNVSWNSSNTSVAAVSNGIVVPVAVGTSVITASSEDGSCYSSCTVTVNESTALSTAPPDGITCTDLGLIKNSTSESSNNFNKLAKAVLENKKILVDGLYFISPTTPPLLSDKSLSITGTTPDSEFKLTGSSSSYFNVSSNTKIEISKVKITNTEDNAKFLFTCRSNALVPVFNVNNSEFYGNIRLLSFYADKYLNPYTVSYGIVDLNFSYNKVNNNRKSLISMGNVPSEKLVVNNNIVNNFDYVIFGSYIDNDSPYHEELAKAAKYLEVKNNYVFCDDTWYGTTGDGTYYCFILFEGNVCVYDNNHVEGLKAKEDMALYDAYLSCQNLTFTNNTFKNNICFSPTKSNAHLLKSKEGGDNGHGKNLIRYYENNTYIIEKSYAEKLGQSPDNIWVYLLNFNVHAASYTLKNNTFDIYDLRLVCSPIDSDSILIEDNTFKATKVSGGYFLNYQVNAVRITPAKPIFSGTTRFMQVNSARIPVWV